MQCAAHNANRSTFSQVQEYLMQLMIKLEKDKAELQIDAANIEHDKVCFAPRYIDVLQNTPQKLIRRSWCARTH